jgi:anaerobic ribonucleoside-triphosphate reductase activating protein
MALTAGAGWRLHSVLPRSRANGPGLRYVIWAQGCTLGCPGCFNPETHPASRPPAAGLPAAVLAEAVRAEAVLAEAVFAEARQAARDGTPLEGVTLTGGEPLEQPGAVAAFCAEISDRTDLGIIILTGFTRNEIEGDPAMMTAVSRADMIIAGRYNARLRLASGLRGSSNKEYWARTGRYAAADFALVPEVELIVGPDGTLTVTGTPRLALAGTPGFAGTPGEVA